MLAMTSARFVVFPWKRHDVLYRLLCYSTPEDDVFRTLRKAQRLFRREKRSSWYDRRRHYRYLHSQPEHPFRRIEGTPAKAWKRTGGRKSDIRRGEGQWNGAVTMLHACATVRG